MEVIKKICSESEADMEHTYFYYYDCPQCSKRLGTSLENERINKCPHCETKLEY